MKIASSRTHRIRFKHLTFASRKADTLKKAES